jgi:membrane carboxypeptidase/penicillin-binding protein
MSIWPVQCVSQLTLLPLRWTFVVVQFCPGGEGGGWLESFAAQNLTVFGGGLNVQTTIDLRLQKLARQAIQSVLKEPNGPSAALVAVRPRTGEILAMYGGDNFRQIINRICFRRRGAGAV